MSITVTSQQLDLVNIISISQVKLCNNFSVLNRRLTKHDEMFIQTLQQVQQNNLTFLARINSMQNSTKSQISDMKAQVRQILSEIKSLHDSKSKHDDRIKKTEIQCQKINDQLFNTQLQFEEKVASQTNIITQLTTNIMQLKKQLETVNTQLSKKESKMEFQKLLKQIQNLKEKNVHFQAQVKLAQHKIQKIQIFNQKNERIQAKKDVEFLKQIQQKVKKQVKSAIKTIPAPLGATTGILTPQQPKVVLQAQKQNHLTSSQQRKSSIRKRLPFNMQQDELMLSQLMKSNLQNPINKIHDRLNKLETIQKDINQNIKTGKINKGGDKVDVKDKINQIKPEVIKLWAKFDTLEDRLAFNQKKMDQKTKILNQLVSHQKQNNWQKMEEKLKTLQTQIFTNIKEIKAKLQTKVNIPQYQKFVSTNQQKIKQINELIYLKSDKLQVKKALLFLQSKIKQIILVISQDEQNQKDALLTKKPIKCISCDKQVDKFSGLASSQKGNWDGMPYKEHAPETLGRFGMTSFGSLSKKLKRLEGKDLPLLNKKNNNTANGPSSP